MKSKKSFKITLHNKNGEVISTIVDKTSLMGLSLEFLESMTNNNTTLKKISVEVA